MVDMPIDAVLLVFDLTAPQPPGAWPSSVGTSDPGKYPEGQSFIAPLDLCCPWQGEPTESRLRWGK
jgi:hypothetical protein